MIDGMIPLSFHKCTRGIPFIALLSQDHPFVALAQPAGAPEISKKSLSRGPVTGGEEMFIIGKNFTKGSKVTFEVRHDDKAVWSREAEIDQEYFQPVSV